MKMFKENAVERQRVAAERLAEQQRAADQRKQEIGFADRFEAALGDIVSRVSASAQEFEAVARLSRKRCRLHKISQVRSRWHPRCIHERAVGICDDGGDNVVR